MECLHPEKVIDSYMEICVHCGVVLTEQTLVEKGYNESYLNLYKTGNISGRRMKEFRLTYKEKQQIKVKGFIKNLVSRIGADYSIDAVYNLFELVNKKTKMESRNKAQLLVAGLILFLSRSEGKAVLFTDVFGKSQETEKLGRFYHKLKNILHGKEFSCLKRETVSCENSLIKRLVEEISLMFQIDKEETRKASLKLYKELIKKEKFVCCRRSPLTAACVFLCLSNKKYKMTEILDFIEKKTMISLKTAAKRVIEIKREGYV